ncbi:MAG: hypothetical protein HQM10_05070 [Candidatus Riflebacteria bacterium]|nr:hypothetical protein [Candidatus Riflebacteria bacterium]
MQEILNEVIKVVIIVMIPIVGKILNILVGKLIEWVESKTHNENLKTLEHEAGEVILAVEGNIVSGARKAFSDGKITQQELEDIYIDAKHIATNQIKERLKTFPGIFAASVEGKLTDLVEAQLIKQKTIGAIVNPRPAQSSPAA